MTTTLKVSTVGRQFILVAVLSIAFGCSSNMMADDGQVFFRFTGFGWGHGYHSYPPRCANSQPVPPWINCGPNCTDRYSLPNAGGCRSYGAGGCQQNPGYHNPGYPTQPQTHPLPIPQYSPQTEQVYRSYQQPVPTDRNYQSPQTPNVPGHSIQRKSSPNKSLPPLESSRQSHQDKTQPVTPPQNSGTSTNPFGVSFNYLSPKPAIQNSRPMNPFQNRIAYQVQRQSVAPAIRPQQRTVPYPMRPNTFNGIR